MRHILEFAVIRSPTCRVDETARNTRNEQLIINLQLDDGIQLFFACLKHAV
jgi:hypothetical protein